MRNTLDGDATGEKEGDAQARDGRRPSARRGPMSTAPIRGGGNSARERVFHVTSEMSSCDCGSPSILDNVARMRRIELFDISV